MRYPAFVRTAALGLSTALLASSAALAQAPTTTIPEPRTMTDTAPLPATERSSIGAVILMDEPVLAQRDMMQDSIARYDDVVDTRTMGAGPAKPGSVEEQLRELRRIDRANEQRKSPK